jgi:glutamate dehydrogenase (NADP+)
MDIAAQAEIRKEIDRFMNGLRRRNAGQREFHQAVQEVAETIIPYMRENAKYRDQQILERLTEPDRMVVFRVTWEDDRHNIRVNRAWRVQFSNAIGPYKGGLRFHSSVNASILKFLGFDQIFKNSLTTLPMGGAKGGSNFNPKGKSDLEVMRFCQSLMVELHRHIGDDIDVPAGDIGVGAREIGYLVGMYRRLENRVNGIMTGKGIAFGGSLIRTEATGYGAVFFMREMLKTRGDGILGKTAVVSGSGNVALYAIEKLNHLGAKVVTASDSDGFIYDPDGIRGEKFDWLRDLKEVRRGRIAEYAEKFGCEYHKDRRPWGVPCDLAFPCATQNEISGEEAQTLLDNGVIGVAEGANMPTEIDGIHRFLSAKILFGPAKAANAGGVAVSGLEQSQNALRISWSREEVESRLEDIMHKIHATCVRYGAEGAGWVNYVKGANIGGFTKVADAMLAYGAV